MEIIFYQAECGDAARLRFKGKDSVMRNVLVDSGHKSTFRYILAQEINSINHNAEKIDLWILTHIHDDHIGGVKKYIEAIHKGEFKDIVTSWYYNPPRIYDNSKSNPQSTEISSVMGFDSGDYIYRYLNSINKIANQDITNDLGEIDFWGLKVTILGPSPQKLANLRRKYFDHESLPLEKNENESISEATKSKEYDYHIKLEDFNLDEWSQDDSIENGSSISLVTEYNGSRVLWLADSHPSDIVEALSKLGYSKENKITCDWVKVTHHGSKGNNSNALYNLIECKNYLMSVNGENIHCLPMKDCVARILRNPNRPQTSKYNFYFTHDNQTLRRIFEKDGQDVFKRFNFEVHYLSDGKYLKISL